MVGELIADRYELEELVGRGGMSSVYRADDRLLERKVALKILHDFHGADSDTIERFRREARAAAQLSHPAIVTVIDRGEDGGRQFIVFEYVQGETLKDLVVRSGALHVRRALELTIETGRALAFAHERGLVHRDVKPQNVLLDGDGSVKVSDFGIARSVDVSGMTEAGTVLGTSHYIAPEQASGYPVDAKTDVYSLGVVLFELLTGDVPFAGDNFVAVAMQHIHEQPPSVLDRRPDVSARVAHAVERALAKDPAGRFGSMRAFVGELEACLAELGTEPDQDSTMIVSKRPPLSASPRARPGRRRRSARPLILVVVALALVGGGIVGAFALLDTVSSPSGEPESPAQPIRLAGIAAFDPEGGDGEHDDEAALATDGDPESYWTTERYEDFSATKAGVGLVLDASDGHPAQLTVETSTPGFTARIDAGAQQGGPFETVADARQVAESTTFELGETDAKYFVLWITELPEGVARVTEVRARG